MSSHSTQSRQFLDDPRYRRAVDLALEATRDGNEDPWGPALESLESEGVPTGEAQSNLAAISSDIEAWLEHMNLFAGPHDASEDDDESPHGMTCLPLFIILVIVFVLALVLLIQLASDLRESFGRH